MEYSIDKHDRATIINLIDGELRSCATIPVGISFEEKMKEIAELSIPQFQKNAQTFQPDAAKEANAKLVNELMTPSMRTTRDGLHSEKRQALERHARLLEPAPADAARAVYERDFVRSLTDMSPAERISALSGDLDSDRTSALLRHGDLYKLIAEPRIIEHVEREHAIGQVVALVGDRHPARPTLDSPVPLGIDRQSARAFAVSEIDGLYASIEKADGGGRAWASLVGFLAAASGQDSGALFERIISK
jgi:hypothetical protein